MKFLKFDNKLLNVSFISCVEHKQVSMESIIGPYTRYFIYILMNNTESYQEEINENEYIQRLEEIYSFINK